MKSYRRLLATFAILLVALAILSCSARRNAGAANIPPANPNVLFIAIDDLNEYVSVMKNYPGLKTPNLDKFVKTAENFTKAYCAAPVCNPSRAALLSGIAPYHSGVYDNDNPIEASKVLSDAVFLPEHFKANGYITLTRGKIFHTTPAKERYEAMWDIDKGKGGYGPNPTVKGMPRSVKAPPLFDFQPWTGPESDHPDNVTAETVIEQLGQQYDKPFFMAAGLYKPHNPWTAPKRFFDMYPLESIQMPQVLENDWDDLPEIAKQWAEGPVEFQALKNSGKWKEVVRSYLACISFMDWNFGRIISALENSGYNDNTIVCVFADNGFHMGEKKHFAKYALWEQTSHILHLWRVPGMTKAGSVCNRPVNLLNIYPTLVELCGLPAPASPLDGRSMAALLKNSSAEWEYPSITTYRKGNQAVRSSRYRYILYNDGSEELYDHQTDPNEWHNLAKAPDMQKVILEHRKHITKTFADPAGGGKDQAGFH